MQSVLINILQILGALAFFIYGMKVMSEGIQRAAGSTFRDFLRSMTKRRFYGLLTGFVTTATMQSSSATTVMTVSLVNAGLLTLTESAGVLMGANIGTTITAWIASILEFKIRLHLLSLSLFVIGVPLLFRKADKQRYWGEFIIGVALLFMGLNFLTEVVPDIESNPGLLEWLSKFTSWGFFSEILFVFVGLIFTIMVQSSSACMVLILIMALKGWIPFEIGASMVLGSNIGTTITAELASLVGNIYAKRTARIHTIFNIIGVLWILPFLHPLMEFISWGSQTFFMQGDPFTNSSSLPLALSAVHTLFNLLNAIVLIWFIPFLIRLASWTLPARTVENQKSRLKFISISIKSPELATVELKKETARFAQLITNMLNFSQNHFNSTDAADQKDIYDRIKKYEVITDSLRNEITEYITKLSKEEITTRTSVRLRSILTVANNLERIGDIILEVSKDIKRKNESKVWFSPDQRNRLNNLYGLLDHSFNETLANLRNEKYALIDASMAINLNAEIRKFSKQLKKDALSYSKSDDINFNSLITFNTISTGLVNIQDFIHDITESITEET